MALFREFPDGSYRSHNCTVVGDVKIGRQSSVWFNTVIRGDVAPITIGQRVNAQDQAVIHCDTGVPNIIEDDVVIGHSAVVHGQFVGRGSLIGMAATLLSQGRPKQRPIWLGVAAVVAASRVHVKIHHASDVVGGAVIGVLAGTLVGRGWRVGNAPRHRRG